MSERLQKFLSRMGIASRRKAELLITAGRIKVNNKVVTEMGVKIDSEKDKVEVDNKLVKDDFKFIYLALNKPAGFVTTKSDEKGRKTVFDLLPTDLKNKVWPVGRLDKNTRGLLLFTNDGQLTQKLTHPSFEHLKIYNVWLNSDLKPQHKEQLEEGIVLDDEKTAPAKIKTKNEMVTIVIHEGKNRQIRRMFANLHYEVLSLQRIKINKLSLKGLGLAEGEYKIISKNDIINQNDES